MTLRRASTIHRETIEKIRTKVLAGSLPLEAVLRHTPFPGSGGPCAGCDDVVAIGQLERRSDMGTGLSLCFHIGCAAIWDVERRNAAQPRASTSALVLRAAAAKLKPARRRV